MDNQLSDCTFKTAFYPTSSCKTSRCLKSFLEITYSKTSVSNHYDIYKYVKFYSVVVNNTNISIFPLYFRYFNISLQDFIVQLDRTFVVSMHKTLSPFLAVFDCPLDARFRQDVSSLHATNIPPVRNFN